MPILGSAQDANYPARDSISRDLSPEWRAARARLGGVAVAAKMTPQQRSARASKAAQSRWAAHNQAQKK